MTRLGVLVGVVGVLCAAPSGAQTVRRSLMVGGVARGYLLHLPPHLAQDGSAALVLAFHGRGGDGAGMERLTGFSALSDRAGFAVAYPDGIDRSWNDGRDVTARRFRSGADDVAFVAALIDTLTRELRLDPRRIFATGISNGAVFAHTLGARLAGRIAAIATVAGGVAAPVARDFAPAAPVSVLIMQGTADPLVPYAGGPVLGGALGTELGADASARLWERFDGTGTAAASGEIPDTDPTDGCRVRWRRWTGGHADTEVWLYTLVGGGHTWPGGPQYLPRRYIGRVCRDLDAAFAIWTFFVRHRRAPSPGAAP